jgi:hypothetical protein
VADRIWLIGGTTVGRDHTPQRSLAVDWAPAVLTNDEDDPIDVEAANGRGDGYLFPFSFDVTQFLRYLLRIRTWHFECDLTIARSDLVGEGDDAHYEWSYGDIHIEADITFPVFDPGIPGTRLVNREADTLFAGGGFAIEFRVNSDGTYGFNGRGNASLSDDFPSRVSNLVVTGDFSYANPLLVDYIQASEFTSGAPTFIDDFLAGVGYGGFVEGEFWPTIKLSIRMAGFGTLGVSWWQGGVYDATEDKGTLTLDGTPTSIKGVPLGDANDSPGAFALSAATVSVDPILFWPYAARDGSAIWDTSSGAQLQDPTN